ncbi:DUF167 family protein [Zobellella endophytica]|uniref:DUF167 family protein n=1 Tax=Zobellella endophytica TaxID=2116700 RepID=UPI001FEA2231|nr:DUF167 family protein [Zobellella endophytica]
MSQPVRLEQDRLYLSLYLQPKASRDQFLGRHGDELKLAITAPPVDGQANAHLLKWLAKRCRVARSQVSLQSGAGSRHKQVMIIQPREIPPELAELLGNNA